MAKQRPNKSHTMAKALRNVAMRSMTVPNPYKEEFTKAAEHIEWLELVLSGIPVKDRKTIASLKRRQTLDQAKISRRDIKIKQLTAKLKEERDHHKYVLKELEAEHEQAIKHVLAKKVQETNELREAIEKEFIESLTTTKVNKQREGVVKVLKRQLDIEKMYASGSTSASYDSRYWYSRK